ncbi:MAG: antibiotic biosynthesis monooxygenase [Pikeienuella sp.]
MSKPVIRRWEARAGSEAIEAWLAQFRDRVMPKYREAEGFRGVRVLISHGAAIRDVVVLTEWDDMAAVERFSGPEPERAVMPDWVAVLMPDHDGHATHYDEILREDAE